MSSSAAWSASPIGRANSDPRSQRRTITHRVTSGQVAPARGGGEEDERRLVGGAESAHGRYEKFRIVVSESWVVDHVDGVCAVLRELSGERFDGFAEEDRRDLVAPGEPARLADELERHVVVAIGAGPRLATIVPDVIGVERPDRGRAARVIPSPVARPERARICVSDGQGAAPSTVDLTEADVIVAAGRGRAKSGRK